MLFIYQEFQCVMKNRNLKSYDAKKKRQLWRLQTGNRWISIKLTDRNTLPNKCVLLEI